ncbi:MAG: IS66 family transposase [Zavarzinella sp.]
MYDQLYTRQNMTEVACWAHARRKFHEAQITAPLQAARAMVLISKLYRIEKEIKKDLAEQSWELSVQEASRVQIRQEKAIPVLKELHDWLHAEAPKLLPKSPIAKAVNYALRHWQALHRYTEQGYLNIDNNAAERALRVIALGRKNWLFAGSEQGGRNAAIIYSIVQSCLHAGVEPQAYLTDILAKLPTWPKDRLSELSPAAWKPQQFDNNNPTPS